MTARRNEVAIVFERQSDMIARVLAIPLSHAQACRAADFELRHGITIEHAILDFLNDELFNIEPACPASVGSAPKTLGRDE